MSIILQLALTGIGIGSIYALVALGLVLIYRATNVVNFAQGDFAMMGAFILVVCLVDSGLPYWLSIVASLCGMVIFGVVFNLGIYYPLRNRSYLPVLISTLGASILIENSVLAIHGAQSAALPTLLPFSGFMAGGVYFNPQYLLIIGVTTVLVALQYLFFENTMLGKKLQATSQDKEMASLLGVPVKWMIMLTFVYSALLGGIAGILVAPITYFSITMGSTIALKAFAASIIGGFGDIRGAIVGGLGLGLIETFGASYISTTYEDAFPFITLFIFLLVFPQGLFGEKISEKA